MKHIGSKLFLGFLCMTVLAVVLLWFVQAVFLKDSYLNQRVQTINQALEETSPSDSIDYQNLEATLNIGILHVNSSGGIVYMSDGLPMHGLLAKQIPDLMKSRDSEVQYLQNEAQETRYALIGQTLLSGGHIFAVFSLVDVNEASRLLLQQLWIITGVLLIAALLIAILLSRTFSKPILSVTQAAKQMAEGNYNVALLVKSKDEIGQLTAALNELGSELEKTESLRRELIANVSHELRSPLAVMQGFAETVRDVTWPDEEKRTSQLTAISQEAARLSGVVTDILDYSKLQAGVAEISISDFAVYPVFKEIADRYKMEMNKKVLAIELICPNVTIRFDQGQFIRVLTNLLNNAINYAANGSTVSIRCEHAADAMKISVENSGRPISAAEIDKIWDRYYRAAQRDSSSIGTGLGLSIVKSILERHHVRFGVSSDESRTVFWFTTVPIL